jgi:hypothetical protein
MRKDFVKKEKIVPNMENRGKYKPSEGLKCSMKVLSKSYKYKIKALVCDKVKVHCNLRVA